MPYVITKGGLISMDHLPAKDLESEASTEVARLEAIRSKNNERTRAACAEPHYRGKSFVHRTDNHSWGYSEVMPSPKESPLSQDELLAMR
jgi:hypothetical protein